MRRWRWRVRLPSGVLLRGVLEAETEARARRLLRRRLRPDLGATRARVTLLVWPSG